MAIGRKTGGRKKGTPNKINKFTKKMIEEFVLRYTSDGLSQKDFSLLEPKERLDIIIKLISFLIPKPASVQMDVNESSTTSLTSTLIALSALGED